MSHIFRVAHSFPTKILRYLARDYLTAKFCVNCTNTNCLYFHLTHLLFFLEYEWDYLSFFFVVIRDAGDVLAIYMLTYKVGPKNNRNYFVNTLRTGDADLCF